MSTSISISISININISITITIDSKTPQPLFSNLQHMLVLLLIVMLPPHQVTHTMQQQPIQP
jgi:hypothetical protein